MSSVRFDMMKRWNESHHNSQIPPSLRTSENESIVVTPSLPTYGFEFSLSSTTGDLCIKLNAPYFNDPAPYTNPNLLDDTSQHYMKCPNLYEFEVVEIFIASYPSDVDDINSSSPYLEIEIGPHGHYFLVYFPREADWENQDSSIELDRLPETVINPITKRWSSEIYIPSFLLPEPLCGDDFTVQWRINLYAIHGVGDEREFIAYSSLQSNDETASPNFHQLQSFVPLILSESLTMHETKDSSVVPSHRHFHQSHEHIVDKKGVMFTQSTINNDNARLLIKDLESESSSSSMKGAGTQDDRGSSSMDINPNNLPNRSSCTRSIEEIAKILIDEQPPSILAVSLEMKYQQQIQTDETVIMHGLLFKRKGWSYKKRVLILTSKPRLLYLKKNGKYRGSILWSITKPLTIVKVDDNQFDIEIFDKSRTYHWKDPLHGSLRWVNAIERIQEVQLSYLSAKMGNGFVPKSIVVTPSRKSLKR